MGLTFFFFVAAMRSGSVPERVGAQCENTIEKLTAFLIKDTPVPLGEINRGALSTDTQFFRLASGRRSGPVLLSVSQ